MQPTSPQPQSAPFVSQKQLNDHINRQVVVAGTVVIVNQNTIVLDSGVDSKITVLRNQPPVMQIDVGSKLLVRGSVKPDLAVVESPTFPPTDVGQNFDLSLYNQATAVTNHINYSHMFA